MPPCVKVITTCVCFGAFSRALLARRSCPDMPRCTITASGSSRRSTRYFPRRCTATILRPSSIPMNSFLFRWRRTDRVPVTSTDLIFLPTTSFSRSRRMTSTSGSSGIVAPLIAGFVLQPCPCHPCCGLLGLFLRASFAVAIRTVTDEDRREEQLRVVGSFVAHDVAGAPKHARRRRFLESRLEVAAARSGRRFGDALFQPPQHQITRGLEPLVEIDRREHCFQRVGQDRLLRSTSGRVFALAQQQVIAEPQLASELREDTGVHHSRAHLRELAFGEVREVLVHVMRHDESEDRVAEELQPLVRLRFTVLRAPGTVRERAHHELVVRELDAEGLLQQRQAARRHGRRGHACDSASRRARTQSTMSRTVRSSIRSSSSIDMPTVRSPSSTSTPSTTSSSA